MRIRKKKIVMTVLIALILGMAGQKTVMAAEKTPRYSNLVDYETRKEVKKTLLQAGIPKKAVEEWAKDVRSYNKTIQNTSLVKKGFRKLPTKSPVYEEEKISELWNQKYNMFIGYNCRITAFGLMKSFVKIKDTSSPNAEQLFMDTDALKYAPSKKFTKKEKTVFDNLFSTVNTDNTTKVTKHISNWKKEWKRKGVSISSDRTKASLITVVLHSSFSKDENELFIGHTGVLVPTAAGKYLFVEKLSFQLPYQAIEFANKIQLNNYLMRMYDTEWGQDTAKPFIMENTSLLKEYHALK